MTDLDLIDLCIAIYSDAPQGFDHLACTSGVFWGLKRTDEADIIVARGSKTVQDWWRDLCSEAGCHLRAAPQLGLVPIGFGEGVVDAYHAAAVLLRDGKPTWFAGHSLGCAHAALMAGIHASLGRPPGRMMLAAPPRPGTATLGNLLAGWRVSQYVNAGDPVPRVPEPIRLLAFGINWPWEHLPQPFTPLAVAPPSDDIEPLRCHHAALYREGIARIAA